MIRGKKLLSFVLAGSMVLSATACSLFAKVNPEEIIDVAESFSKTVSTLDGKKILKNVEELDKDDEKDFKDRIAMMDLDPDERSIKQAIADTIKYEVDEESVEIKKDTASCDVEFSIVDYENATGDLTGTPDDFMDAIASCKKTVDYDVTLEFVKVEDEWLVTADSLDELDDLYSFIDCEFDFVLFDLSDVDECYWLVDGIYDYSAYYVNTTYIEYDVWFVDTPQVGFYYEIYLDGRLQYTSDIITCTWTYLEVYYDEYDGAAVNDDWYLVDGEYNIKVYTEDGMLIADDTATVETIDLGSGSYGSGTYGDDTSYQVYDDTFADIVEIGWTDFDYTYYGDGLYSSDAELIELYITTNGGGPEVYFEYYYLGNYDDLNLDLETPIESGYVSPDTRGVYYFTYAPEEMEPGIYYVCIGAPDTSVTAYPYITAIAIVY